MFDDDAAWLVLALLAALVAVPALLAGGAPLLPLFLAMTGLACAAHRPSRVFALEKANAAFSGSALRTVAILTGALLMFQLMPFELALLMAGDVLAYVEVLAAVSLIAAHARLSLIKVRLRSAAAVAVVRVWRRPVARARRLASRLRRPARPASEDGDGAWALA